MNRKITNNKVRKFLIDIISSNQTFPITVVHENQTVKLWKTFQPMSKRKKYRKDT